MLEKKQIKTVARVCVGEGETNEGKLMATASIRERQGSKPVAIAGIRVGEAGKNKVVVTASFGKKCR